MQLRAYSLSTHRQNPNRGRFDYVKQTIQERRVFFVLCNAGNNKNLKKKIDDTS